MLARAKTESNERTTTQYHFYQTIQAHAASYVCRVHVAAAWVSSLERTKYTYRFKRRPMRKVVFAINITADGYCSHMDGVPDDAVLSNFTKRLSEMSLIIFGRTTYQLMVPYWPDIAKNPSESEADKAFARAFEALDKVVFSTTLQRIEGDKTRLVRAGVAEEVLALKQQPGKVIGIGSLSIASQLSARGMIDEYSFFVHPVLAGKGPRLFDTVKPPDRLHLDFLGSESFPSGVVALNYRKHT